MERGGNTQSAKQIFLYINPNYSDNYIFYSTILKYIELGYNDKTDIELNGGRCIMNNKPLPIGIDNFEMIITRGYYFVDKTLLIIKHQ